ncbi:thrombospondin type 1 domain-containing protein [Cryptosporidium serpentis]
MSSTFLKNYYLKFWLFLLYLTFFLIFSKFIYSLPPSYQWNNAWTDITDQGAEYIFTNTIQPWFDGISFRFVGEFIFTKDQETIVTIYNGNNIHCKLSIDYKSQLVIAESSSESGDYNINQYTFFPFTYKPQNFKTDIAVEKLVWPGGFYFYIVGNGPYYYCRSVTYVPITNIKWGSGYLKNFIIKRNIPLGDPYRRIYIADGWPRMMNFVDNNLYYVNNTVVDKTTGAPTSDRIPTKYKSWPYGMDAHIFGSGMWPTNQYSYRWNLTIAVMASTDNTDYYYRLDNYFTHFGYNKMCTINRNTIYNDHNLTNDRPYAFDIDYGAQPFTVVLINQPFGVEIFAREMLWTPGGGYTCGRYDYNAQSFGIFTTQQEYFRRVAPRYGVTPVNCEYSQWSTWMPCSSTCKGGTTYRWRYPLNEIMAGGLECPNTIQESLCNVNITCSPCEFEEWSTWSECSTSCQGGTSTRTRTLINNITDCMNMTLQSVSCNNIPCPINCILSEWSSWTLCPNNSCSETKSRYRVTVTESQYGGNPCPPEKQLNQVVLCLENCTHICEEESTGSAICQNGGECINYGINQYICKCKPGYFGVNCEISSENTVNIVVGTSIAGTVTLIGISIWYFINRT